MCALFVSISTTVKTEQHRKKSVQCVAWDVSIASNFKWTNSSKNNATNKKSFPFATSWTTIHSHTRTHSKKKKQIRNCIEKREDIFRAEQKNKLAYINYTQTAVTTTKKTTIEKYEFHPVFMRTMTPNLMTWYLFGSFSSALSPSHIFSLFSHFFYYVIQLVCLSIRKMKRVNKSHCVLISIKQIRFLKQAGNSWILKNSFETLSKILNFYEKKIFFVKLESVSNYRSIQ